MQTKQDIEKIVHDAVIEVFDLDEKIKTNNLAFKNDLNASSLDMVSLALVLEDEFSAEIEENKMEDFITIDDVINYVIERQNKN